MKGTAFLYYTHYLSDVVLREIRRLSEELHEDDDFWVVGCVESPDMFQSLAMNRVKTCAYSRNDLHALPYPGKLSDLKPERTTGSNDLALMRFFRDHPDYTHYWVCEYDVRYSGSWAALLGELNAGDADLMCTHLTPHGQDAGWPHWETLKQPDGTTPDAGRLRGFMPFCRLTRRFFGKIDAYCSLGWRGHYEALWPTIASREGFVVEEIGGDSAFTPRHRAKRFYHSGYAKKDLFLSTFAAWPVYNESSRFSDHVKDTLWHPVKEATPIPVLPSQNNQKVIPAFHADMPGRGAPGKAEKLARPSPVHLGELIFRQTGADILAGPPRFHRLTIAEVSPKPEPLVQIPGLHEEPWAAAFHASRERVHDLGLYCGVDLTVVGDGYLFAENLPLFQSDIVVPYILPYAERQVPKTLIEETRPVIVAYDRGFETYGHFLIDVLPRLFIAERMLGQDFRGALVLLPHNLPAWGRQIFDFIFPGVRTVTFDPNQYSLRLRRAILPTHCHKYYMFHPFARTLFQHLLARAEPIAPSEPAEFIFLSRAGISSNRKTEDFEEIETYAASLGAKVLRPEAINWREQLGYFAAARLVVGEYGSALHNTIFANDGVRTLAINRLQFLQSFIGALNKQRLTYLLPSSSQTEDGTRRFMIDHEAIKRSLGIIVQKEFGS